MTAVVLFSSLSVHAQEWRYRVRPGDSLWDLGRLHLRSDVPWERLQEHNAIQDPWKMAPGTELRFPIAWLRIRPVQARVIAVQGDATVHPMDAPQAVQSVRADMRLAAGSVVRTGPESNLSLGFADGSQLQLHGGSELRLDRLSAWGSTGMVDTRLRLLHGRTTNAVRPSRGPASRFVLDTPGTMATVRGTRFRVGHGGERTHAEVLEGAVQVSAARRTELVRAGHGSVGDAAHGPGAAAPLLPAPDLTGWPESIDQVASTIAWPQLDGAVGYRVQVAPDPGFLTLVTDIPTTGPEVQLPILGDGRFHVRVRGVDARGLEGLDAVTTFHAQATPAPPFTIAPAAGSGVAGPRPRLQWTRSSEPGLRYRVQLAGNAGFADPLYDSGNVDRTSVRVPSDLEPGAYSWRVRAIDRDGPEGPWSGALPFTLTPPQPGPTISEDDVVRSHDVLQVGWPAGHPGQRYLFQLSRDADFTRIDRETVVDTNRIELDGLRSGTWHMRTALVDSDGYAHPFGPAQSVRIGCLPCRIALAAGLLLVL